MLKTIKLNKNSLSCNDLILKAMYKRRKMAVSAIYNICDIKERIRLVK